MSMKTSRRQAWVFFSKCKYAAAQSRPIPVSPIWLAPGFHGAMSPAWWRHVLYHPSTHNFDRGEAATPVHRVIRILCTVWVGSLVGDHDHGGGIMRVRTLHSWRLRRGDSLHSIIFCCKYSTGPFPFSGDTSEQKIIIIKLVSGLFHKTSCHSRCKAWFSLRLIHPENMKSSNIIIEDQVLNLVYAKFPMQNP